MTGKPMLRIASFISWLFILPVPALFCTVLLVVLILAYRRRADREADADRGGIEADRSRLQTGKAASRD